MTVAVTVLCGLIALEHVYFLVLEMFLWTKPLGLKVFRQTPEKARDSAVLASNQGLYNGFLAAGLAWAIFADKGDVAFFFLCCVTVAGIFGGWTVNRRIFFLQGVPAIVALLLQQYAV